MLFQPCRPRAVYYIFWAFPVLILLFLLGWNNRSVPTRPLRTIQLSHDDNFSGVWNYTRDAKNTKLSNEQCEVAFPQLYEEIDRAAGLRRKKPITLKELDEVPIANGYIRAMIFNNELFMITAAEGVNTRHFASLSAIHRAILTSPDPIPNIEFILNVNDVGPLSHTSWTYARPKHDTKSKNWLMPDYGFYSWPEPHVGAYNEIQAHAIALDQARPWVTKISKLIWRGNIMGLKVREDLLKQSLNQTWSAVRYLDWVADDQGQSHDHLTMWDHCRYKFVAHTEGVSYSARLQNLQNCRSIIVAHEMYWAQHHTHLMFADGPNQNFVQVKGDWSDLRDTMKSLLEKDSTPRGRAALEDIVDNSVTTFRERYITPAAEACYWRRLFLRWAEVSPEPEFFKASLDENSLRAWRAIPVENYLLMRTMEWNVGLNRVLEPPESSD